MSARTVIGVAAVILSIAAATGCSTPDRSALIAASTTSTPPTASATTTVTSSMPPLIASTVTALGSTAVVVNERNNLVKHLGELAGLHDAKMVLLMPEQDGGWEWTI
jgi:hypothetical protein